MSRLPGCDSSKTNNRVYESSANEKIIGAKYLSLHVTRREMFVPRDICLTADRSRRKIAASKGCSAVDASWLIWKIHMFPAILVIFRHKTSDGGRFEDSVRIGHRRTHDQAISISLHWQPLSSTPFKGSFGCLSQLLWCSISRDDPIEKFGRNLRVRLIEQNYEHVCRLDCW